jgi:hypothetical protein
VDFDREKAQIGLPGEFIGEDLSRPQRAPAIEPDIHLLNNGGFLIQVFILYNIYLK